MDKEKEYELLMQLEIETTKMRHTTFTAILSISFILPGLALRATPDNLLLLGYFDISISKIVFMLGFLFYNFSVFHYLWYHRLSHLYRKKLKELESEIGIHVYQNRIRPMIGNLKFRFHWSLYIIWCFYGYVTALYVGVKLFIISIFVIIGLYLIFLLFSYGRPIEPLE